MDGGYITNPVVFLIQVLFGAYIFVVLLRFLLQLLRADFYNPVSQFVVKVTSPVLVPMRRFIPGMAGLDLAALLLAWLLKTTEWVLVILISKGVFTLFFPLLWAIPELLDMFINIFLFAIIIQVVLSWVSQGGYHPAASVLHALTNPVLQPVGRLVKPIAGIDLGPMVAILGLYLLKMILLPPIRTLVSSIAG